MLKYSDWIWLRAIFEAVEGDTSELVRLMQTDLEFTLFPRRMLARWLAGDLPRLQLPKGHPPKNALKGLLLNYLFECEQDREEPLGFCNGHDLRTELGKTGMEFDFYWRYIRKKNWHRKRAGRLHWSSERLLAKVADRNGIKPGKLANYLKRHRPKRQHPTTEELIEMLWEDVAYKNTAGK